jgi:DNA-directed RNA polymerase subunit RPC12/RpoP
MLKTKELYDQELKEARATLTKVDWYSPSIVAAVFKCDDCQSELIEQIDPQNDKQDLVEFHCKTCGGKPKLADTIERTLEDIYGHESYYRQKDSGENGPIYQCPACNKDTLVEGEDACANCSEPLDYETECTRCNAEISIQDYLDGLDNGLCSYCSHVAEKMMRDD